ncbi:kelch-like protein 10 [Sarotherodon galilaeus]
MAALWTLAFISLIAGFSCSRTSECSYYSLLDYLNLTSSNVALETMRPVKNWTRSTVVQVDLFLLGILESNEKSQTFTNEIRVHMSWTNEFLTWNPSEFCGIEKLSIMRSMLWFPDVIIVEDVSDDGSIRMSPLVTVYSNGSVNADFQQRLTFACRLNLFVFPFDLQTCYITFSSLNSDVDSITFGTISDEKFLTQVSDTVMLTRGEWELKHIDIQSTNQTIENKSYVSFRISMLRKPMLYVIDFIIPLFYFLIMDLASFFISEARGKKLSFKVTILLSISVLLLLLKDILPSTEKDMPIISSYCMVIFTMVAVSVLETMLVMFLMDFEGFSCFYKKARNCENAETDVQLEPMEATAVEDSAETLKKGEGKPKRSDLLSDCDLLKLILDEVKAVQEKSGRQDEVNGKQECYRRLAVIIDRVFFVLYLIASTLFVVLTYLMWIPQML